MENKKALTPENWAELTDEEKTIELQKLLPGADYKFFKKKYEDLLKNNTMFEGTLTLEHPVIVLKLIDPVMAPMIAAWMYTSGEKLKNIPVFGYSVEELCFNKLSLVGFSETEQDVLNKAVEIINKRMCKDI